MPESSILIYVTVPNNKLAEKIASTVVSERLAACANIIPGMRWIYTWQGKIERRAEAVLFLKTQGKHYAAVEARVKALHSDETPCIVAVPLTAGNDDYMQWIKAETTPLAKTAK